MDALANDITIADAALLRVSGGRSLTTGGDLTQKLQARLRPEQAPNGQQGQQQRAMVVQAETTAKIVTETAAAPPAGTAKP